MEANLQRRIQRYGWDRAARDYESLWHQQLTVARDAALRWAALNPGDCVLDVACGTGLVTFAAARAVAPVGDVLGVDLSGEMIEQARQRAAKLRMSNVAYARMDAEALRLASATFDVALCVLGLMYMPDPAQAMREIRRVLRPGGHAVLVVWGERSHCGWAPVFPIVDAEVRSEVCPLFFQLGNQDTLARRCADANLQVLGQERLATTLAYSSASEACDAAFVGGPVALAWSKFNPDVRARVRAHYTSEISPWKHGGGYRIPGEFVVVAAAKPEVERDR